jgi:hypothetical protein
MTRLVHPSPAWPGGGNALPLLAAVLAAVCGLLAGCAPEHTIAASAPADDPPPSPTPSLQSTLTPTPPATPSPTPTARPATASPPTPTSSGYGLEEVRVASWVGAPRLHLLAGPGTPPQEPVPAEDLRLPVQGGRVIPASPYLIPKGRNDSLLHLGADYLIYDDPVLVPPHPDAILVAATYLIRGTYLAIALDLSGETQMYLVTLAGEDGPQPVLLCYTHLLQGSNAEAKRQALANEGRVETMGRVATVTYGDSNPSDLHIAAISVAALYQATGENDLAAALRVLFSGEVERTVGQYPELFLPPDSVLVALQEIKLPQ